MAQKLEEMMDEIRYPTSITTDKDFTTSGTVTGVTVAGTTISGTTISGTNVVATGYVKSSGTTGVGYATGAGGAVSQLTNRTTGVTLAKVCGVITTSPASLGAGATATFAVTNSLVSATDVIATAISGGSNGGNTIAYVNNVGAGSFVIAVSNLNAF